MGHTTTLILNGLVATTMLLALAGAVVHVVLRKTGRTGKFERTAYVFRRSAPYSVVLGALWFVLAPIFH